MIRCCFITGLLAIALLLAAHSPAQARSQSNTDAALSNVRAQAAYREAIRNTPLLMRPDRPGHFYGNTVRRIHAARQGH